MVRFWQGREGPISNKELFPMLDRYLLEQSLLWVDGATAYASYVAHYSDKEIQLHQLSHQKKEYVRYERLTGLDGSDLGIMTITTNDIDGGWSHVRLMDRVEGGNFTNIFVKSFFSKSIWRPQKNHF